jgi:hypothetical protein
MASASSSIAVYSSVCACVCVEEREDGYGVRVRRGGHCNRTTGRSKSVFTEEEEEEGG